MFLDSEHSVVHLLRSNAKDLTQEALWQNWRNVGAKKKNNNNKFLSLVYSLANI